jgi:hypothetical protein
VSARNPRGYTRQLRYAVDGLDDLIGCEVVHHVAEAWNLDELALG